MADKRATTTSEARMLEQPHTHPDATGQPQRELSIPPAEMPDLAPMIHRQRLVIEGLCDRPIDDTLIRDYLSSLSRVCDMRVLIEPVTHRSDKYGWAGWIHWETSGAHFYAWETPLIFFSVDIYTCKPFDPMVAIDLTAEFLQARRVVAKGF